MIELGKKDEIFGADALQRLQLYGEPKAMPTLPEGHCVIAGYDQGLGERMIVCESFEEMRRIYQSYASGGAVRLYWYSGPDAGFVAVFPGAKEA